MTNSTYIQDIYTNHLTQQMVQELQIRLHKTVSDDYKIDSTYKPTDNTTAELFKPLTRMKHLTTRQLHQNRSDAITNMAHIVQSVSTSSINVFARLPVD